MANYRPQLFLRTADITVALNFPEGTEDASEKMVMPGDHVEMVCELVHDVAAEIGSRFTLREGNKTGMSSLLPCTYIESPLANTCNFLVGTGIITKIFD